MNDHDLTYLRHIRDAIYRIEEYVHDVSREEFFSDQMRQDAVIRQLSIIGEAAGGLSEQVRETYTSIPWADVYRMRNKLVHDYFGVDLDAVWDTVRRDLHPLLQAVEGAIQDLEAEYCNENRFRALSSRTRSFWGLSLGVHAEKQHNANDVYRRRH